jgi:hypothetical protein
VAFSKQDHTGKCRTLENSQRNTLASKPTRFRSTKCVPVFPWKWLGSTKGFETTLFHLVEAEHHDFQKGGVCLHIHAPVPSLRSHTDLLSEGNYQKRFLIMAVSAEIFSEDIINIDGKIQAIQNSIESGIHPNTLTADTDDC